MKTTILYLALVLMGAILQKIFSLISERVYIIFARLPRNEDGARLAAVNLISKRLMKMLVYIKGVAKALGLKEYPIISGLGAALVEIAEDMKKEADNAGND